MRRQSRTTRTPARNVLIIVTVTRKPCILVSRVDPDTTRGLLKYCLKNSFGKDICRGDKAANEQPTYASFVFVRNLDVT